MKIVPFEGIGAIKFGMSRDSVVAVLGSPEREGISRKGSAELHYPTACYRFDSSAKLVEITVDAPVVEFGPVSVPFKMLDPYLRQHDKGVFERVGFVVSPALGVALDPHFCSWVTAFPRESLSSWQAV